jgi:hypothetical protein
MLAIFMQAEVFLMLAQLDTMPAVGRLEAREATGDALLLESQVPAQGFIQAISQHLHSGGRDTITATPHKAHRQIIFEEKLAGLGILLFRRFQHLIVKVARFDQATHQQMALRLIGVEPVLKCSHALIITQRANVVNEWTRLLISPWLKPGALRSRLVEPHEAR